MEINSLTPGRGSNNFEIIIFELLFQTDILRNSTEIVLWRMPEPMLTQFFVATWRHYATMY